MFSRKQTLTLELGTDFKPYVDELKEKDLAIEIKVFRKKRSLDANAFFWATIGDISEKIGIPPREIYREMIRDIGGNYDVLPIKTARVELFQNVWEKQGEGWICESIGASKFKGYTNMRCYYGSSTYDTAQMSRLIDLAVEEAKAQGIQPRLTARERQAAIEMWGCA